MKEATLLKIEREDCDGTIYFVSYVLVKYGATVYEVIRVPFSNYAKMGTNHPLKAIDSKNL